MRESNSSTEVLVPDMVLDPAHLPQDIRDKAIDTNELPDLRMAYLKATVAANRAAHTTQPEPLDCIDVQLVD